MITVLTILLIVFVLSTILDVIETGSLFVFLIWAGFIVGSAWLLIGVK
jgi:hypothetical protein